MCLFDSLIAVFSSSIVNGKSNAGTVSHEKSDLLFAEELQGLKLMITVCSSLLTALSGVSVREGKVR